MANDSRFGALPSAEWSALQAAVERFEDAWQKGDEPRIEDFLPADAGRRGLLLTELLHADLEWRLNRGLAARVEDYLARFPEMAAEPRAVLDLVVAEFRLRRRREPDLDADEFLRRFPQCGAELDARLTALTTPQLPGGATHREETRLPEVPGYEVLGELGRGGMGVVFKARHLGLGRLVALKMIRAGEHGDPERLARFLAEARAADRLRHPNVVQVYEVGEHGGRPYAVLEYLEGGGLDKKLAHAPQPPREAARLVETLARAVHAAHREGVVHRDLKPSNVLLCADGTPRVADFGLAKLLDGDARQTRTGEVLGTPSYMAPEQAAGEPSRVGPAADVWALGAILYECLTGQPPFRGPTVLDTLEQVRSREPVPVRQSQPAVPRDLETVCLKCLRKEPHKRYPSAEALADDLRRFLDGRPILARPVGVAERGAKWARRNPAVAAALTAVGVVAVAAFAAVLAAYRQAEERRADVELANKDKDVALVQANKAREDEKEARGVAERAGEAARAALRKYEVAAYASTLGRADQERRGGNHPQAAALLDGCRVDLRHWEWRHLRSQLGEVWRGGENMEVTQGLLPKALGAEVVLSWAAMSSSPDGATLFVAAVPRTQDGRQVEAAVVSAWRLPSGQCRLLTVVRPAGHLLGLALRPDGRRFATVGADPGRPEASPRVTVWDTAGGKELLSFSLPGGPTACLAYSPDGSLLVTGGRDARVWEAETGRERAALRDAAPAAAQRAAFSPDGKRVALTQGGAVKVWDAATGEGQLTLKGRLDPAAVEPLSPATGPLAFSPDGTRLAVSCGADGQGELDVWDAATGRQLATLKGGGPGPVAFSGDGRLLAGAIGRRVEVWDARTFERVHTLPGFRDFGGIAFDNGRRLAACGVVGDRLFFMAGDLGAAAPVRDLVRQDHELLRLALSGDGRRLAALAGDNRVHVCDADTGEETCLIQGPPPALREPAPPRPLPGPPHRPLPGFDFSRDGRRVALASEATVLVFDAGSGARVQTFKEKGPVGPVAFSPDGGRLASAWLVRTNVIPGAFRASLGEVVVRDVTTGDVVQTFKADLELPSDLAFSADGKTLTAVGFATVVWDLSQGTVKSRLPGFGGKGLAFSPDGKRLASWDLGGEIRVRNAASGDETLTLTGPLRGVSGVAFSPDGWRLAASGGPDGAVYFWDLATGKELLSLAAHEKGISDVRFHPDGRRLLTCGLDGRVKVWDAPPREERLANPALFAFGPAAISPDRETVAVVRSNARGLGASHESALVSTLSGEELLGLKGQVETGTWEATRCAFSPDGKRLAVAGAVRDLPRPGEAFAGRVRGGLVRLWDATSGEELFSFKGHAATVTAVAFSPGGDRLAGTDGHEVLVWETKTGTEVCRPRGGEKSLIQDVTFCRGGSRLAATVLREAGEGRRGQALVVWDAGTGRELTTSPLPGDSAGVACSPDGRRLVSFAALDEPPEGNTPTSGRVGEVSLWDADAGGLLRTLPRFATAVSDAAFSPDGSLLAVMDGDGLTLWDVATGERAGAATFGGAGAPQRTLGFTPDGARLSFHDGQGVVWVRLAALCPERFPRSGQEVAAPAIFR